MFFQVSTSDIESLYLYPQETWEQVNQISVHSSVNQISKLLKKLDAISPPLVEKFKLGCFGDYYYWPKFSFFPSLLAHNILCRQIKPQSEEKYVIWFGVGGHKVKFSCKEFCLISGLKLGKLDKICTIPIQLNEKGLHMRYWEAKPRVHPDELQEKLGGKQFQEQDDALRMVLILFVHFVIMGQEKQTPIEKWLFNLSDNLDEWNKFSWGHYAWMNSYYYLKRGFKPCKGADEKAQDFRYHLYGYSWPFVV